MDDQRSVAAVFARYATAVAALYAGDGVPMANIPTPAGNAAVRAAYEGMIAAIRPDIVFAEVRLLELNPFTLHRILRRRDSWRTRRVGRGR